MHTGVETNQYMTQNYDLSMQALVSKCDTPKSLNAKNASIFHLYRNCLLSTHRVYQVRILCSYSNETLI